MAFKVNLIRPDDLLNLQIECRNLILDKSDPVNPALVSEDAAQIAYFIVYFPPQTIAEEAVYEPRIEIEDDKIRQSIETEQEKLRRENSNNSPQNISTILNERTAVRARLGQPTRLVFKIPANSNPRIPYSIEGLLNWTALELSVSLIADIRDLPTDEQRANASITPPSETETAIEMPYRLILSPNSGVVWTHATTPKNHLGHTELWHTRLAYRTDSGIVDFSQINPALLRAIWSPDYVANPSKPEPSWPILGKPDVWAGQSVLTAMNARDRHELVILTSAFKGSEFVTSDTDFTNYEPMPIQAEQVMLSPLGGWLKSRGNWKPPIEWIWPQTRGRINKIPDNELQIEHSLPRLVDIKPVVIKKPVLEEIETLTDPVLNDPTPFFPGIRFGEPGQSLNISEWVHVATQGRDHYVRIVYEGYLYPFGHRAALVKVTERKFSNINGSNVAYLAQRMFIIIREPLKDYLQPAEKQEALPNDGREMPLKQVQLTTLVTPDIDTPKSIGGTQYSFWVEVGGSDFKFHAVGHDGASPPHTIDFTAALIFVSNVDADNSTAVDEISINYKGDFAILAQPHLLTGDESVENSNEPAKVDWNRQICKVPGQPITYAPANDADSDNTTYITRSLFFDTDDAPNGRFLPKLEKAIVNLTAVEQLLGTKAETEIHYYANYIANGFDSGNEVFAELSNKVQANFSADKAGGIATPNLSITGITRKIGVVSGELSNAAKDEFSPDEFFKEAGQPPKLFGQLQLTDLILPGSFDQAPKIQYLPDSSPPRVELSWKPNIKKRPPGVTDDKDSDVNAGVFVFTGEPTSELIINGTIEKPTDGSAGKSRFSGQLTFFSLEFLGVIKLNFDSFSFTSETGKKPEVNVQLNGSEALKFLGDLEFVNELKEIIPPGLFGDGPSLEITPEPAIRAGFAIGLPPVAVGVFALKDVSLGAALTLPFLNGSPLFDFNVSERHHPFNLTVAFFGGGGFFHLQLDTQAIRVVEASFEFGASISINLGVASGGVYVMAGIYFKLETKDGGEAVMLSGFFRMGGELSVLGLISLSLEFYLSFTYESESQKATGMAQLTVKVEVLFFSKCIVITVEKKFGGQNGDPKFVDVWDNPSIWSNYAKAFA